MAPAGGQQPVGGPAPDRQDLPATSRGECPVPRGDEQHRNPKSDIEIAQAATMRPIGEIADKLGVPEDAVSPYRRYKAENSLDYVRSLADPPNAKLILVTPITPTSAGDGKT